MTRSEVVAWLTAASDTEFVSAVSEGIERRSGGWEKEPQRFALAEIARHEATAAQSQACDVSLVAFVRYGEPFSGVEPYALRGVCAACGTRLVSQVSKVACPVCGQAAGVA
jgi:hypothetical protein